MKPKTKNLVIGLWVVVQVLVLLTGVVPSWVVFFKEKVSSNWEGIVPLINLQLLIIYVATSDLLSKQDIAETLGHWTKELQNKDTVRVLHENEFYAEFESKIVLAERNVDICHFGKSKPLRKVGTAEEEYYEGFRKVVLNSPATFRRVERLSPEKLDWIENLIKGLSGQKNFSLACLNDPDMTADQILPMSVQRIDSLDVYMVAVGEHYSTIGFRDIHIRSREVTDLIAKYFSERIWNRSVTIIERGKFHSDRWAKLKKGISAK